MNPDIEDGLLQTFRASVEMIAPPETASSIINTMVPVWRNNRGVITVRFVGFDNSVHFAKLSRHPELEDLDGERKRTLWLSQQGIATVTITDYFAKDGQQLLISREIDGVVGIVALQNDMSGTLTLLGKALAMLHALPVEDCPFQYPASSKSSFVPSIIHGDPVFPNFLVRNGREVVFLDCGDVGIGDPYIDIAAVLKSLSINGIKDTGAAFFTAYGLEAPDPDRLLEGRRIYDGY